MYRSKGDLLRRPKHVHIYMGRIGRGRNNGQRPRHPINSLRRRKQKPWILILASIWASIKTFVCGFFRILYKIPIFCLKWMLKGSWWMWSGTFECVKGTCGKFNAKKQEWDRWNPDQDNPCVMCIDASKLAGLKETVKKNVSFSYRLFWLVAFIALLITACYVGYTIYKADDENPIESVFQTFKVEIDDMPVPTVKSCPSFSFKLSKLDEAKRMQDEIDLGAKSVVSGNQTYNALEVRKLLYTIDNICHAHKTVGNLLDHRNRTITLHGTDLQSKSKENKIRDDGNDPLLFRKILPFILEGTSNCDEMLQTCIWNGMSKEICETHFTSEFTNVGGCCTFNKMPDKYILKRNDSLRATLNKLSNKKKKNETHWKDWSLDQHNFVDKPTNNLIKLEGPLKQSVAGFPGALTYLVRTDERNAACPMFDSIGTRILISVPGVDGDVQEQSVPVPPNSEVNIKLYPVITIAQKEIQKVPMDKRKCYFEKEYELEFYNVYIQENCHQECMANFLRKKCGCSLLALPNPKNAVLCSGKENFQCVRESQSIIYKSGFKTECPWCKPNCNEMSYRTDTTVIPLRQSFINKEGAEGSVSIVNVGFADSTASAQETKIKHNNYEKIGMIGSVFETFNDISVLGVVRVIVSTITSYLPVIWDLLKYICFGLILSKSILFAKFCMNCCGFQNNVSAIDPHDNVEARRDSLENVVIETQNALSDVVLVPSSLHNREIPEDRNEESPSSSRADTNVLDNPECSIFVITEQPRPTPRTAWEA